MSRDARWKPNAEQNPSQRAIAERLVELKSNPFEAAQRGGLPRTFIYEYLTGKKVSFSSESIEKVAKALKWEPNELVEILSGNGAPSKVRSDSVERSLAEAAFAGLVRNLRPDIRDMPDLVELFRTLILYPPETHSLAPLAEQMFLRAQLPARQFAPK